MLSNAELALASLGDAPTVAPVRRLVLDIKDAALHASELTNQMLAYSGRGHFEVRTISLNEMVRDMEHLLGASVSKKARVDYQLAPDLPPVRADVAQMHQLVMNLITNASEALEERAGVIRVRTGVEQVRAALPDLYGPTPLAPGQYVFLEVTDDGCGMDAETRARLFEPFFTTKFTGRGLGLSAVQGIMRGHAGGITLRTAVHAGTTIKVLFPRSEQALSEPPSSPHEPAREWPTGSLVMLVDDNARVREVTKILLNSIGFEVLSVGSGREAIRKFEEYSSEVRVVLLDAMMPDLSGEQVLRELRKRRADLPVIICSGYSEQEIGRHFSSTRDGELSAEAISAGAPESALARSSFNATISALTRFVVAHTGAAAHGSRTARPTRRQRGERRALLRFARDCQPFVKQLAAVIQVQHDLCFRRLEMDPISAECEEHRCVASVPLVARPVTIEEHHVYVSKGVLRNRREDRKARRYGRFGRSEHRTSHRKVPALDD